MFDMMRIICYEAPRPDWYYNLVTNPNVTIYVCTVSYDHEANIEEEPDRIRLYDQMAAQNPGFDEYRQNTSRIIPAITMKCNNSPRIWMI